MTRGPTVRGRTKALSVTMPAGASTNEHMHACTEAFAAEIVIETGAH